MSCSMRKVLVIASVKGKTLFSRNFITMPLFTLGIIVVLRSVFDAMGTGNDSFITGYLLNFGLIFNITLMGIYVTSAALAEEKEKNTLRTLMTSSVTGIEFFLGSILPITGMIMIINLLLLPVSGSTLGDINLLLYLFVTLIATLTSCIIGMIMGIFAKNQVSASTITTPVLMIFIFIPTFAGLVDSLQGISSFLFTGVISDMANAISTHTAFSLGGFQLVVLIGEILISILLFLYCYHKNGYEAD